MDPEHSLGAHPDAGIDVNKCPFIYAFLMISVMILERNLLNTEGPLQMYFVMVVISRWLSRGTAWIRGVEDI